MAREPRANSVADLEVCLDVLAGEPQVAQVLGERGRAYVERHYRWSDLVDRYASFVESVALRS